MGCCSDVVIVLVIIAGLAGLGSPAAVSVSGSATSSGLTLATEVIFTSSTGQVYATSVLASVPHGGSYQIWLPNNEVYQVQVFFVGTLGNGTCKAGTISIHQGAPSVLTGTLTQTFSC